MRWWSPDRASLRSFMRWRIRSIRRWARGDSHLHQGLYSRPRRIRCGCAQDPDRRNDRGPGFDLDHPGRKSGLHGAGRSAIRGGVGQGRQFDSPGCGRRRNRRRREVASARGALSSKPGAMRNRPTEPSAIQQPMIEPIFGGKSAIEVMAVLLDSKDRKGYDLVKNYWTSQWPARQRKRTREHLEKSSERRRAGRHASRGS